MLIGMPCDRKMIAPHVSHCVGEKYIRTVVTELNAAVVLIPAFEHNQGLDTVLAAIDGVLLPGSYSNVAPARYQQQALNSDDLDEDRDALALPLISAAFARGMPVLGLCRGMQEINVAFGGSLHQQLSHVPELATHGEDKTASLAAQYAPAHWVELSPKGWLAAQGKFSRVKVNSLHQQGIDRLGNGLQQEAVSDDGLIEAISCRDPERFLLGVQWHPEWQTHNNPFYRHIFSQFGAACGRYQATKQGQ
ncbi:gamma-glutamyl-gamma-aminobutyrate hydrolase family protein [Alteromonas sp. C1M14]|uniref:gamma-glutamyl-gamma-aminobutyrate hydrolase family protein n=1 Tax=Alteromonas sp. C1M14 TaxID=2841567 RepID=UPI001C07FA0F|nr:gamma-glutamyl-gamma-aminobutyrate hydrolase family protein [Alteromonas sp. C1M14]MBU2978540.1 gamma-glutamyl-gamma-aminobutyrate hydrolase family protein [Alteromonas sp. C1M14]